MIATAGEYKGGEFQVEGTEAVKLKGGVWSFNGKDAHRSLAFKLAGGMPQRSS